MTHARRWFTIRFFIFALLLVGALPHGFMRTAHAQVPLAGSTILNKATATYQVGDQFLSQDSNEVRVTVQPLEALRLTPDNSVRMPPGAPVNLPHRLTNIGNVAGEFTLSAVNLSGDGYDLNNLRLFRDANGNGQLDQGETELGPADRISLAPNESVDLVINGAVPLTATVDQIAQVRITATSALQAVTEFNTDTIRTVAGVSLRLSKAANRDTASRGDEILFSITSQSLGASDPAGIATTVDGQPRTLAILRDVIPANTTFVDFTAPPVGTRLYHRVGDPLHTYLSTAPPTAQIDAVAYGVLPYPPRGTVHLALRVRVNANATGRILNTAILFATEPFTGTRLETPSNTVQVTLPRLPPVIAYYSNDGFTNVSTATGIGLPLWVQGEAASCNLDPTRIERVPITLRSQLTGDSIQRIGIETGPNTGIFRILPGVPTSGGAADPTNDTLEVRRDDTLTARLQDCGGDTDAVTNILVDPLGIVFDSRTNVVVPGTRVTLIDVTGQGNGGNAGGPARVFDFDGVTLRPSTIITGADGSFQFPQVAPSTYRLQIEPPTGFSFPTKVPVALLPPGRVIDLSGSFGGTFQVTGASLVPIQIDIPLDSPPPSGLFLEKTASKRTAELGDFVDYEIRLRNASGIAQTGVTLEDLLPRGFSYVPNSTRFGATRQADPAGGFGPRLTFLIGDLIVGGEVIVSYRAKIGAGAARGDNINRAQAQGTTVFGTTASNVASAVVKIVGGVFTTRGIIYGKVFVDKNRNRVQNKGEDGIPGVRVWLEDGTFAVTDTEGKYTIYGVKATTHTVKVDATTLPAGAKLQPLTNRHGRKGDSAWADVKNGEMHKVNFADSAATPEILEQVARRRTLAQNASEIDGGVRANLNPDGAAIVPSDPRSLPAAGTISAGSVAGSGTGSGIGSGTRGLPTTSGLPTATRANSGQTPSGNAGAGVTGGGLNNPLTPNIGAPGLTEGDTGTPLSTTNLAPQIAGQNPRTVQAPQDGVSSPPVAATPAVLPAPLEDVLPNLSSEFGILDLKDGDTLAIDQLNVRVKGTQGAVFKLWVNGEEQLDSRVGTRSVLAAKQLQAWEYIGVRLKAGSNTLEAAQFDPFGNERGRVKISVIAPGKLGGLRLWVPPKSQSADGLSPVKLRVELVDERGTPVTARTPITLEASRGAWLHRDLSDIEPGTQVFIEGGRAELTLLSPAEPGECLIRVSSGLLVATGSLTFVPELRPLVASGVVDTKFNLFKFRPKGARPINTSDLFEDDLRKISESDSTQLGARGALFLKGRVQGKYLLTMRYDSEKDSGERLFRDIQPDEFYPVYGDSSIKGFDAQSTSRLYVRVDKNQSYVLYGDYLTSGAETSDSLSRYSRSLNGLQLHHETQRFSSTAFFSRDNTRRVIDEIPARGISGPYRLRSGPVLEGSEKVEIIVRDRNQPGVIISTTAQTRFTDYSIDGLTDGIVFRRPIASLDPDLNPVYIRVTYEVEQGGPNFNVQGMGGQFKLTNNFQVGANFIKDSNPQEPSTLRALNAVYRLSAHTVLFGEWAKTGTNLGSGAAQRLELVHNSERLQARLFVGRSDLAFNNPESVLSGGRGELSARANYRINDKSRLSAEIIRTEDRANGGKLTGAQVALDTALSSTLRLQTGLRHASSDGAPANGTQIGTTPGDFTTAFARLAAQLPKHPEATLFARYERSLSGGSRQSMQVGGEYQIANRSRVYVAHEFLDSFGGLYALNESQRQYNTRFGVETDYMKNGSAFGEYRLGNGIDGRSAQAAFGLRNLWPIAPGVKLNTSFERVQTLGGGGGALLDDGTAAGVGIEWLRGDDFRATARVEGRLASGGDSLYSSAGLAWKPARDWTLLARQALSVTDGRAGVGGGVGTPDRTQGRLQLGVAYRQTTRDKWSALAKYEYRYNDDAQSFAQNLTRRVHILSADANYQPMSNLQLRLHYAWKKAFEQSATGPGRSSLQLLSGRITKDLNNRFDLSLIGSMLWGDGRQGGAGIELGYLLKRDLLISIGYNLFGFHDVDLSSDEWTQRGLYMRMRFKFDEDLLNGWNGFRKASTLPEADNAFKPVADAGLTPAVPRNDNPLSGDRPGSLGNLVNQTDQ